MQRALILAVCLSAGRASAWQARNFTDIEALESPVCPVPLWQEESSQEFCFAPALEGIKGVAWKLALGVLSFLLVFLGMLCTWPIPWKGSKEDEAAEDTPLAGTMEDQALKKAELAALQQARCKAEKEADETDSEAEEKTFEAWAEHVFPRLTPEHQAKAALVKLTGLGSCSKCRWGAGCSSCSFPHACLRALREESNLAYRP